jgi:hypothetical protein
MNARHLQICKKEIEEFLQKSPIRKSLSPWSWQAFYVENVVELERGVSW